VTAGPPRPARDRRAVGIGSAGNTQLARLVFFRVVAAVPAVVVVGAAVLADEPHDANANTAQPNTTNP
jgi:hypothetical protein